MNKGVEYTQMSGSAEHLIFGNRILDEDIVLSVLNISKEPE